MKTVKDKKIRCPDCNSNRVSLLFCTDETIVYCQNNSHNGLNAYTTTHHDSKDFGKKFKKVHWDYRRDEE